jgi:di/tricarboxylate transporter
VSLASSLGASKIHMFDFYSIAAITAVPALIYLWLIAPWLLRSVKGAGAHVPTAVFSAQLHVKPESAIDGATLKDVFDLTKWKMRILEVRRGDDIALMRLPTTRLKPADRLLVEDTAANLKNFAELLGAELHGIEDPPEEIDQDSSNEDGNTVDRREDHPDRVLAEMILTAESPLTGMSLRQSRFADVYGLFAVGLRRSGASSELPRDDIPDVQLRAGDVLLVQGTEDQLRDVKQANIGLVLDVRLKLPRADKAGTALVVLGLVITTSAFKLAPIALSALAGVFALLAMDCLRWRDISASLSMKVALLVASSLALGQALTVTGGTAFMAEQLVQAAHEVDPRWFLALLMLIMGILTNFVSNNAAAAIGTPLAIDLAHQLGIPAESLILAVLFGCNLCYVTPMGYQTNLLVMNAAGYRFGDFVKVGLPLFVLVWACVSMLLIRRYGL